MSTAYYVPHYLNYGPRDSAGWPTFVGDTAKEWLTERVRTTLVDEGPCTLQRLYDVVWQGAGRDGALAELGLDDVVLWDAIYACLHRAALQAEGESCWRVRRDLTGPPAMPAGEVQTITIIGRMWGPDQNGNSHCGATLVVNGERVGQLEPCSAAAGVTAEAADWLDDHGYISRKDETLGAYCRRRDITLHLETVRVARKCDL